MQRLIEFIAQTNLAVLVLVVFVFHLILYLLLGTPTWLSTSLLATAFYGVLFYAIRVMLGRRQRVK